MQYLLSAAHYPLSVSTVREKRNELTAPKMCRVYSVGTIIRAVGHARFEIGAGG